MVDDNKRCRHFTGMINHTCDKGYVYRDVRDDTKKFPDNFPCNGAVVTLPCADYEARTPEEISELHQQIASRLADMFKFDTRETEDCPHCGNHVTELNQVGRCVYARPCGCRVWQGGIPSAWKGES
jgi:hypothetical protein